MVGNKTPSRYNSDYQEDDSRIVLMQSKHANDLRLRMTPPIVRIQKTDSAAKKKVLPKETLIILPVCPCVFFDPH
jgi:hypothetical protein